MSAAGISHVPQFTADCSRQADLVSLRVSGRLIDARQVTPNWEACLERLGGTEIRLDMGGVTEIDARGLGMIAELTREARRRGGRVAVVKASPRVQKLLKLTHLDSLLEEQGLGPRRAA